MENLATRLILPGPLTRGTGLYQNHQESADGPNDAPAEVIAQNVPNAASMWYDAGANQLVIPMNPNHGLAFVPLE